MEKIPIEETPIEARFGSLLSFVEAWLGKNLGEDQVESSRTSWGAFVFSFYENDEVWLEKVMGLIERLAKEERLPVGVDGRVNLWDGMASVTVDLVGVGEEMSSIGKYYRYMARFGLPERRGQICKVLAWHGSKVMIEFRDGFRTITVGRVLRKVPQEEVEGWE